MLQLLFLSVSCLLTLSTLQTFSPWLTGQACADSEGRYRTTSSSCSEFISFKSLNGSGSYFLLLWHLCLCVPGRVLRSQPESLVSLDTQPECPGLLNNFRTASSWGPRSSHCHRPSYSCYCLAHILHPIALSLASLAGGIEIWRRKRKLLQVCSLSFHTCSHLTFVSHL